MKPFQFLSNPFVIFIAFVLIIRLLPHLGLQYYDEGTDAYYQVAIEGLFTAGPENLPAAWGKWTFVSNIHEMLYHNFPDWNWYSIILLALTAWCLQLFVAVVKDQLSNSTEKSKQLLKLGVFLLLGILIWENIVLIQFTRVAQFLCFFGLLHLVTSLKDNKLNWGKFINGTTAFVVGTMIRLEPGILALGLLLPIILTSILTKQLKIKAVIPILILPIITCGAISYLINNGTTESDRLTVVHNKFLHNTDGVKYEHGELNISNESDSLAYQMTFSYYMNDPKHLNQEFTDRIGLKPFMSSQTLIDHVTRTDKFKERWNNNFEYLQEHFGLVILFLLISFGALLFPEEKTRGFSFGTLGAFFIFVAYYIVITGYMKMDHHVFIPLLFCFSFIMALRIGSVSKLKLLQWLIILLSAGAISHELEYVKRNVNGKKIETAIIDEYLETAVNLNKSYMVFDMRAIFRLYTKPFQELPVKDWSNAISFDNGLIFVMPSYKEKLIAITGSSEIDECWKFVAARSNNTVFLAKGDRLRKTVSYFNQQYGLDMNVKPISRELANIHEQKISVQHDLGIYIVTSDDTESDQSISKNNGPGKRPL
jgi:hypothetical protein